MDIESRLLELRDSVVVSLPDVASLMDSAMSNTDSDVEFDRERWTIGRLFIGGVETEIMYDSAEDVLKIFQGNEWVEIDNQYSYS